MNKIILFFLGLFCASAQTPITVEKIFDKVNAAYKDSPYITYNSRYIMYDSYTSKNVYENYSGFYIKKGNRVYFKLHNTEVIVSDSVGAKINHDQKAILIGTGGGVDSGAMITNQLALQGFKSELKTDPGFYICEFTAGKLTQAPYNKVIVFVNKKDFTVAKQILYLSSPLEGNDKSGKKTVSFPRLEIQFTLRKKDIAGDEKLLSLKNYFTIKNNTTILSQPLAGYQIFHSN
ncbi:hypothetical protein [Flavobacterium rhizosphaerae]|uniref:Outer membrane lipoprotein-sorting protein n=1 Tax=Flavobacterium rhizosphaerae TaxID=3163298 RepID=A0ABW8YUB5_9FLAO